MQQYQKDCRTGHNPIMFCVCRGKYAEGYDFKDELCRKLYVIGVPNLYTKLPKYDFIYISFKTHRLQLKKWYFQK